MTLLLTVAAATLDYGSLPGGANNNNQDPDGTGGSEQAPLSLGPSQSSSIHHQQQRSSRASRSRAADGMSIRSSLRSSMWSDRSSAFVAIHGGSNGYSAPGSSFSTSSISAVETTSSVSVSSVGGSSNNDDGSATAPGGLTANKVGNIYEAEFGAKMIFVRGTPVDKLWTFSIPKGWRVFEEPFKQPLFVPFVMTDMDGKRTYGLSLTVTEATSLKNVKAQLHTEHADLVVGSDATQVYIPKAVIVLSSEPIFGAMRRILCSMVADTSVSLQRWAGVLTKQVMMPAPGQNGMVFTMNGCPVDVAIPAESEFPLLDFPIANVFQLFSVAKFCEIISAVIMDGSVVFVSSSYNYLTMFAESMRVLLYPLPLITTYVPQVTAATSGCLQSIGIYMFGVHKEVYYVDPAEYDEGVWIVDIDTGDIQNKSLIVELPTGIMDTLQKSLRECLFGEITSMDSFLGELGESLFTKARTGGTIFKSPSNVQIQQIFLDAFVSLLGNFMEYVVVVRYIPEPVIFFEKIRYVNENPSDFARAIVQTSTFDIFMREFALFHKNKLFTAVLGARKQDRYFTVPKRDVQFVKSPETDISGANSIVYYKRWAAAFEQAARGDPILRIAEEGPQEPVPKKAKDPTGSALTIPMDAQIPLKPKPLLDIDSNGGNGKAPAVRTDSDGIGNDSQAVLIRTTLEDVVSAGNSHLGTHDYMVQSFQRSFTFRALFAMEVRHMCDVSRSLVVLQGTQFEWLGKVVFSLMDAALAEGDTRCLRIVTPQLVRITRHGASEPTFLCNFIEDLIEDRGIWMSGQVWEEVILASLDNHRRSTLHSILQADMKRANVPSTTVQDLLDYCKDKKHFDEVFEKEEEAIFDQLKCYASVMMAFGFSFDYVRKFVGESLVLATSLSDKVERQLRTYLEEADESNNKRQKRKYPKPRTIYGAEITNLPEIRDTLLPKEETIMQSQNVMYISSRAGVAEGAFFLTNYRFIFVGVKEVIKGARTRNVCLDVPLGTIADMQRFDPRPRDAIWTPAGIAFKTYDAKSFDLCFDGDNPVSQTEVYNAIRRQLKSKQEKFMFVYQGADIFNQVRLTRKLNFSDLWKRPLSFIPDMTFHERRERGPAIEMDILDMYLLGLLPGDIFLDNWTICNERWQLCSTYPSVVFVPTAIANEVDLAQLQKYYVRKRFPSTTWVHPRTQRVLMRSALTTSKRGSSITPRNLADEKLLQQFTITGTKVYIITENETELMFGWDQTNMDFWYRNVSVEYVKNPSKQKFSTGGIFSRFMSTITICNFGDPDKDLPFFNSFADNWLYAIEDILTNANLVMELIEDDRAHVLLSLENGWDRTLQISSVAQILLDPFYRTIYGLQVLIEKEWIKAGHRFSERCEAGDAQGERAPYFLQFLDCVWQLLQQFPNEFEYNEYYLRFIAHESYNQRFGTFAFSSEQNAVEEGRTRGDPSEPKTVSLWEYINTRHMSSPDFYNFRFMPPLTPVLRPKTSLVSLFVWERFFLKSYYSTISQKGHAFADFDTDAVNDEPAKLLMQLAGERSRAHQIKNPMVPRPTLTAYIPEWLQDWTSVAMLPSALVHMTESQAFDMTSIAETASVVSRERVDTFNSTESKRRVEGFLQKRAEFGVVKLYSLRRFAIDLETHTIDYFEKDKGSGFFTSKTGSIAYPIQQVWFDPREEKKFNVSVKQTVNGVERDRVYELRAANIPEMIEMGNAFADFAGLPRPVLSTEGSPERKTTIKSISRSSVKSPFKTQAVSRFFVSSGEQASASSSSPASPSASSDALPSSSPPPPHEPLSIVPSSVYNQQLKDAVQAWDVALANKLLNQGADVNSSFDDGSTLLQFVVRVGDKHLDMAQALLDHGADVNVCDEENEMSMLHLAAVYGQAEVARLLIEKAGASETKEDKQGRTPADVAIGQCIPLLGDSAKKRAARDQISGHRLKHLQSYSRRIDFAPPTSPTHRDSFKTILLDAALLDTHVQIYEINLGTLGPEPACHLLVFSRSSEDQTSTVAFNDYLIQVTTDVAGSLQQIHQYYGGTSFSISLCLAYPCGHSADQVALIKRDVTDLTEGLGAAHPDWRCTTFHYLKSQFKLLQQVYA